MRVCACVCVCVGVYECLCVLHCHVTLTLKLFSAGTVDIVGTEHLSKYRDSMSLADLMSTIKGFASVPYFGYLSIFNFEEALPLETKK